MRTQLTQNRQPPTDNHNRHPFIHGYRRDRRQESRESEAAPRRAPNPVLDSKCQLLNDYTLTTERLARGLHPSSCHASTATGCGGQVGNPTSFASPFHPQQPVVMKWPHQRIEGLVTTRKSQPEGSSASG